MSEVEASTPVLENRMLEMAVEIISAYVTKNAVPASELPSLIFTIYASLGKVGAPESKPAEAPPAVPAVPIKKSVHEDYIICLNDGKKFKSLKRHLQTAYGLLPEDYRAKWGLPSDYPMVAPAYAKTRSDLAKKIGLGKARKVEKQKVARPRQKKAA